MNQTHHDLPSVSKKTKQNKTKTKQNKNKTKQNKTKQNNTRNMKKNMDMDMEEQSAGNITLPPHY